MSIRISRSGIKKPMTNDKGLTLVELLFAVAVVSVAMLSSVFLVLEGRQLAMDARARLLALNAARSVLEAVKDMPLTAFDTIDLDSYVPTNLTNGGITLTTNPSDVAGVTLATVTVGVSWLGAKGRSQTLEISTQRSIYS